MRRPRFLNTILGVVIGAACSNAPTAPPEVQQGRVLPPLSAFTVSSRPVATEGSSEDTVSTSTSAYPSCTSLHHEKKAKDIGILGGYLDIGPHTLVVPAGALNKKTKIEGEIVGNSTVNAIKFKPEGLQFNIPAYLFLSYQNCDPAFLNLLQIVYADDDLTVRENEPSLDDLANKTVVGLINHFSIYAVAY